MARVRTNGKRGRWRRVGSGYAREEEPPPYEVLAALWDRCAGNWPRRQDGLIVGIRSLVRCVKNKLAAPGAEAELDMRYPVGPLLPQIAAPVEVEREMGDGWAAASAG